MSEVQWRRLTRLPLGKRGHTGKPEGHEASGRVVWDAHGAHGRWGLALEVWWAAEDELPGQTEWGLARHSLPRAHEPRGPDPRGRGCGQRRRLGKSQTQDTSPRCALPAHSWVGQSPGARAALLWALAAALERREPTLTLRLERHGVEPKAAKAEVELSVRRLRQWGARAQAQNHSLQVRGVGGPSGGGSGKGSGMSQTWGPSCNHQQITSPLHTSISSSV